MGEGDKRSQKLADTVGITDAGLELLEDRANLERAFHVLSGRERVIIYLRFYESVSQTEIAGVSTSRRCTSRACRPRRWRSSAPPWGTRLYPSG
jgi:DNA-directed RNA polymerase specialized sigma subunit